MEKIDSLMELQWLTSFGKCMHIHSGSCTIEVLKKMVTVSKLGCKYYLLFHFIPFLLRMRQVKTAKMLVKTIKQTVISYVRSVLFMVVLVGMSKAELCLRSKTLALRNKGGCENYGGSYFSLATWIPSLSIMLQGGSRSSQIGYFVLAKALTSLYTMLKRIHWFSFSNQGVWMHVILMSLCYYIYTEHPQNLKFSELYSQLWGRDDSPM